MHISQSCWSLLDIIKNWCLIRRCRKSPSIGFHQFSYNPASFWTAKSYNTIPPNLKRLHMTITNTLADWVLVKCTTKYAFDCAITKISEFNIERNLRSLWFSWYVCKNTAEDYFVPLIVTCTASVNHKYAMFSILMAKAYSPFLCAVRIGEQSNYNAFRSCLPGVEFGQ